MRRNGEDGLLEVIWKKKKTLQSSTKHALNTCQTTFASNQLEALTARNIIFAQLVSHPSSLYHLPALEEYALQKWAHVMKDDGKLIVNNRFYHF